jgi:TatD DNase family protein
MLVDSHCHLDLMKHPDPGEVLAQAEAHGVTRLLNISVDLESFPSVLAPAQDFSNIYATVGLHPNTPQSQESDAKILVKLADHAKVLGIGETGLDYFRSEGDLEWQRERFRYHIRAARECGKPLIIHCREAREDTLRILREERAQEVGGIMHCFVEDWDTAQAAMELGFYISFSGILTFKSAIDLKAVAKKIPAERLLVETDAPYLAPVPHRGQPNCPAYVRHVAEYLAHLRGETFTEIAEMTSRNFDRLFRLETVA